MGLYWRDPQDNNGCKTALIMYSGYGFMLLIMAVALIKRRRG